MPNGKTPKDLGYETQDVQWPLVLWSMAGIVVLVLVSIFGLLLLFSGRDKMPTLRTLTPMSMSEERPIPTGPLLQRRPPVDMETYLDKSNAHMSSFGWVDEAAGQVHIPIERAMEFALEQGYPTGTPAPVVVETTEPEVPAAEATADDQAGEDAP